MPICTRCKKNKPRYQNTTICHSCAKHAKSTKRSWNKGK